MNILVIVIIVITTMTNLRAQQAPQFSQYMFNQLAFNPAYAGTVSGVNLELSLRKQWLNVEGSPFTQTVGAHLKIPLFKSGVGIQIKNETLGAYRDTRFHLFYAYHLEFKKSILSFGTNVGAYQRMLDGSKLITSDGVYSEGLINHGDLLLPHESVSAIGFDLGLGVYYKSERIVASVSVQHLLKNSFKYSSNIGLEEDSQTFFGFFGYKFDVSSNIRLIPSFLIKSDMSSLQGEVNILLGFKDLFKAGVSYRGYSKRSSDALIGILSFNLTSNLMLGYSYDYTISGLNSFSTGSHEITLHYNFDKILPSKGGKVVFNTRFL